MGKNVVIFKCAKHAVFIKVLKMALFLCICITRMAYHARYGMLGPIYGCVGCSITLYSPRPSISARSFIYEPHFCLELIFPRTANDPGQEYQFPFVETGHSQLRIPQRARRICIPRSGFQVKSDHRRADNNFGISGKYIHYPRTDFKF